MSTPCVLSVLEPYERLDDGTPVALGVDRLMCRLRCSAKEVVDLAECLRALDADPRGGKPFARSTLQTNPPAARASHPHS